MADPPATAGDGKSQRSVAFCTPPLSGVRCSPLVLMGLPSAAAAAAAAAADALLGAGNSSTAAGHSEGQGGRCWRRQWQERRQVGGGGGRVLAGRSRQSQALRDRLHMPSRAAALTVARWSRCPALRHIVLPRAAARLGHIASHVVPSMLPPRLLRTGGQRPPGECCSAAGLHGAPQAGPVASGVWILGVGLAPRALGRASSLGRSGRGL